MPELTLSEKNLLAFVVQASPGDQYLCKLKADETGISDLNLAEFLYHTGYVCKMIEESKNESKIYLVRTLKSVNQSIFQAL